MLKFYTIYILTQGDAMGATKAATKPIDPIYLSEITISQFILLTIIVCIAFFLIKWIRNMD